MAHLRKDDGRDAHGRNAGALRVISQVHVLGAEDEETAHTHLANVTPST